MIYLDNASTTQVSKNVFEAMRPYFMEKYGNPGNLHSMGLEAANAVEKARAQVAAPIHADPSEIIFTSGGSEANSLAITGLLDHLANIGRTHIVVSNVEHASVLAAVKLAFDKGFEVTYVPVDHATGCVKPQAVIDAMGKGKIEYRPFPEVLKGKYQSFTEADPAALLAAGYNGGFFAMKDAVKEYCDFLASGGYFTYGE